MSTAPDTVEPAEAMLAELAGLDLTLARHLHACATATEDTAEVTELARAYQRISRSLRQTLALHARLKRERIAAAKADPPPPPPTDWVRLRRRQGELRAAVCRVIWDETESEGEEEETLLDVLGQELRRGAHEPDFGAQPLDDHVLKVCAIMNLPLAKAERWRDLPDLSAERRQSLYEQMVDVENEADEDEADEDEADENEADGAGGVPPAPAPFRANGRLARPPDVPSREAG